MSTILVIEDTESIRSNIAEILKLEHFEVLTAKDGYEGIEAARQHHPDLILCDIMMPEIDGYAVLEILRKDPVTATIPFLFLTAKNRTDDIRRGMIGGADDYITKPFKALELISSVKARLERHSEISKSYLEELDAIKAEIQKRDEYLGREVDLSSDGIAIVDGQGVVLYANKAMIEMMKVDDLQDIIGKELFYHVLAEHTIYCFSYLAESLINPNQEFRLETSLVMFTDETPLPVEMFFLYFDKINEKSMVKVRVRDISPIKYSQEKAREQEIIFNSLQEAVIILNPDYTIQFWNHHAEDIYGWTKEMILNKNYFDLLPEESTINPEQMKQLVLTVGNWFGEIQQINRHGMKIMLETRWKVIYDEDRIPQSILIIAQDITPKE